MSAEEGTSLVERSSRIVLRPIANPLPLGFLALAGGTFVLAGLQLGWVEPGEGDAVALILLGFVAPLQLVAAIFGFLGRDGVAATGMGILAGTWSSIGLVMLGAPPGATSDALGLLLLVSAAAMLVPASGAAMGKIVAAAVLVTTSVRFALSGVYELTANGAWADAAGVVGVLLAVLAFYAALAMELEDVARRTLLPVLRRGAGRRSIGGNLSEQVDHIESEAGVREQL